MHYMMLAQAIFLWRKIANKESEAQLGWHSQTAGLNFNDESSSGSNPNVDQQSPRSTCQLICLNKFRDRALSDRSVDVKQISVLNYASLQKLLRRGLDLSFNLGRLQGSCFPAECFRFHRMDNSTGKSR